MNSSLNSSEYSFPLLLGVEETESLVVYLIDTYTGGLIVILRFCKLMILRGSDVWLFRRHNCINHVSVIL